MHFKHRASQGSSPETEDVFIDPFEPAGYSTEGVLEAVGIGMLSGELRKAVIHVSDGLRPTLARVALYDALLNWPSSNNLSSEELDKIDRFLDYKIPPEVVASGEDLVNAHQDTFRYHKRVLRECEDDPEAAVKTAVEEIGHAVLSQYGAALTTDVRHNLLDDFNQWNFAND